MPSANSESGDNYRSQTRSSLNGRPSAQLERDGRRSAPHTPTGSAPSSQRTSRNALSSPTSPFLPPAHTEPIAPSSHSMDPSSPAIVLPVEVPEAGPQVSMSYLPRVPPNDSGAQSFLSPDVPASIERRKSYDDGTRPLNILFKNDAPPNSSQSLRVTDRASKRNSINPGTTFNYEAVAESYKSASAPDSPLPNVLLTPDTDRTVIQTDARSLASKEQAAGELSSQPSRTTPADTLASTSVTSSNLSRSRSRTESIPKPTTSVDSVRPPLRQNMILERTPPRTHSLNTPSQDSQNPSRHQPPVASVKNGTSSKGSSNEKDKVKHGSSLSIDVEKSRAGYSTRPMSPAHKATSPAHKVDVPRGIESGTDTSDGEREPGADEQSRQRLPSTRKETKPRPRPMQLDLDMKRSASQDESFINSADVDSEEESSPVERVSRSTFIAPAHPPIRVSMTANGFQELLSLVDPRNRSSLQSIEELVKLNQDAAARLDSSRSSTTLNLDSNVAQSNGQGSISPASATTPTTLGSSSIADNASVTTISAPSSHGHGETFVVIDQQHEKPNGVASDSPLHRLTVQDASPTSSNGPSSGVSPESPAIGDQRIRLDSTASRHTDANELKHGAHITITAPDPSVSRSAKPDTSYTVTRRLRDALQEAARHTTTQIMLDQELVQVIIMTIEQRRDENAQMKGKMDHIKVRRYLCNRINGDHLR
jgi:hypothetical protein